MKKVFSLFPFFFFPLHSSTPFPKLVHFLLGPPNVKTLAWTVVLGTRTFESLIQRTFDRKWAHFEKRVIKEQLYE